MGFLADPQKDTICCDSIPIKEEKKIYYLLNKPRGYVCTNFDELGRPRAIDLLGQVTQRIYTVGRLDVESDGLIILTNDGEFANLISHPRYSMSKTYQVEVEGHINREDIEALKRGIWLSEGKTSPAKITNVKSSSKTSRLEITLREGRNREIRRILATLEFKVRTLRRIKIGWLSDPQLKIGKHRRLRDAEVTRFLSGKRKLGKENRTLSGNKLLPGIG
jgi:23S rRNA pseudouridine2605 synthase